MLGEVVPGENLEAEGQMEGEAGPGEPLGCRVSWEGSLE